MGIPKETIAQANEILQYIPQRDPVVMVDTFYGFEGDTAYSALTVTAETFFTERDELDECGLIEHIAQSAALRAGYLFRSRGKEIPLGFIASVGKLAIYRKPRTGETIMTEVTVEQEVMDITLLRAQSSVGGKKCCECTMKIFLKPENDEK